MVEIIVITVNCYWFIPLLIIYGVDNKVDKVTKNKTGKKKTPVLLENIDLFI